MHYLSIIIPVYNEAQSLPEVLSLLGLVVNKFNFNYEVIIIDDYSSDGTGDLLDRELGFKILHNHYRMGYGASIKRGVAASKGDLICLIDGDGTYDVSDIPLLLKHAESNHMVVGARPQIGALFSPLSNKLAKWLGCFLLSVIFLKRIQDINSGLRIIQKKILNRYSSLLPDGFSLTSSITLIMLIKRYRVAFVRVNYYKRKVGGNSKVKRINYTINFIKSYSRIIHRLIGRPDVG